MLANSSRLFVAGGGIFCANFLCQTPLNRRKSLSPTGVEPVTFGFGGQADDSATNTPTKELKQLAVAEVTAVMPCAAEPPFSTNLLPELAKTTAAWNDLPPAIRAGITAMIEASTIAPKHGDVREQTITEEN